MRKYAPMALPPRALRRNRMLLTLGIGVFVPILCVWTGALLLNNPHPAPLLVMVDDVELTNRMQPAQSDSHTPRLKDEKITAAAAPPARPVPAPVLENLRAAEYEPMIAARDKTKSASKSDPNQRWFNGRPIRPVGTTSMLVTAYSPDERSCGESADGITASGYSVWTNGMKMVAADTSVLPFGTLISVPGYDQENVVPVLDRGGAIKGHRLDLLYPTHEQARQWGSQKLTVTVWEYADGLPNDFRTQHRVASR